MFKEIKSWEELYEYVKKNIDGTAEKYGNQYWKAICIHSKRVKIVANVNDYSGKCPWFYGTFHKLGQGCIDIKLKYGKWELGLFRIVYLYAEMEFKATLIEVDDEGSAINFSGNGVEVIVKRW